MKKIIKKSIEKLMPSYALTTPIVQNINLDLTGKQKRILFCYMNFNAINKELKECIPASNRLEEFQIIRILIKLNFVIDVCAGNDSTVFDTINMDEYDYVLGFGSVYRTFAKRKKTVCILYMTENPYYISYQKAQERIDYLKERHNIKIKKMSRTGFWYLKGDEELADYIICLGEEKYYSHLNKQVYRLFPSGLKNINYIYSIDKKKMNYFLVFGAIGVVHKGIDLLIDVFSRHPNWKLFLCGNSIKNELKKLNLKLPKNIILCGFLNVNSEKFVNIVSKCAFVILPSCSEASTTGVLTGMRHGLIPIVCRGNGFERCEEYCLFFEDYHIDKIDYELSHAVKMSEREYSKLSKNIYTYANKEFSLKTYTESMENILRDIVVKK